MPGDHLREDPYALVLTADAPSRELAPVRRCRGRATAADAHASMPSDPPVYSQPCPNYSSARRARRAATAPGLAALYERS